MHLLNVALPAAASCASRAVADDATMIRALSISFFILGSFVGVGENHWWFVAWRAGDGQAYEMPVLGFIHARLRPMSGPGFAPAYFGRPTQSDPDMLDLPGQIEAMRGCLSLTAAGEIENDDHDA